jgi:ACS family pantothenate transporter-like MFS transporter
MASRGCIRVQQNNYPTGVSGAIVVAAVFYSVLSDKTQSRRQCSFTIVFPFALGSVILIAKTKAEAGHFFAFYFLGTTYAPQALWSPWMADVTAQDFQLRAIMSYGGVYEFP